LAAATAAAPALATFRAGLSVLYTELGRTEEAQALLDGLAFDGFSAIPDDLVWLTGVAFCAHACARLGDRARAPRLLELLLPYRDRFVIEGPSFLGSVSRYLGVLAATLEQWADADTYFAEALDAHVAIDAHAFAVLTRLDWARMLLQRGVPSDRARARAMLED